MNPVILLSAIPILATATCLLALWSQRLYLKIYEPHISFEPVSQFKAPSSKLITFFTTTCIALMLAPLFLWSQGWAYTFAFIFSCGYAITFLTSWISRAITSIFAYKYLQHHPHLIIGRTIFKPPVLNIIHAGISLQHLILVGVISCFMPNSAFLIGAMVSLALSTVTQYFSKNRQLASV